MLVLDKRRMDFMKFMCKDKYFTLDKDAGRIQVISNHLEIR